MGKVAPDMEVGPAAPVAAKKAKRGKKIVFGNEKKVLKAKAMEKQRIR